MILSQLDTADEIALLGNRLLLLMPELYRAVPYRTVPNRPPEPEMLFPFCYMVHFAQQDLSRWWSNLMTQYFRFHRV